MATMDITAAMVKKLRDETGAGMMECKAALTEANGDIEEATTLLRKRGLAAATKKAGRSTRRAGRPLHPHGRQDRRAGRGQLRVRLRRPHRRVPGAGPRDRDAHRGGQPAPTCAARTCRPTSSSARRTSTSDQVKDKPAQVIDKIVEGKLNSFYEQVCLLDQPSMRDPR